MALAHGYTTWIGFAAESDFGTPVVPTKFIEIESESMKREQRNNVIATLGSPSQGRTVASKVNVSGSFTAPMQWEGPELLLKHAMGAVSTGAPSGGIYPHTFTLSSELPTGLTIEINRDDDAISGPNAYQYAGCKISKLTLSQEMEKPLMMTVDIIGKEVTTKTKASVSLPTYNAIDYAYVTEFLFDSSESLPARSFKITIDNSLHEDQYRLGSTSRAGITRGGQRKITFEAECEYDSDALFYKMRNLTKGPLSLIYTYGTRSMAFTFPNVTIDGDEPNVGDSGPIYCNVKGTALQSSAANDELSIVWSNTTSSV